MSETVTTPEPGWKFLDFADAQIRSRHGHATWTPGEWKKINGPVSVCIRGFHSSDTIFAAFGYVKGDILARVEGRGEVVRQDDKAAYAEMRITGARRWTARDSVELAIFAAGLVIEIYEDGNPGDDRPRKAIEAAKAYLASPSHLTANAAGKAACAAYAADAADAADAVDAADAADAAYAAAYTAAHAAYAADAAAHAADAADAAAHAAYAADAGKAAGKAAYAAAYAAVDTDIKGKIETWLQEHFESLGPVN